MQKILAQILSFLFHPVLFFLIMPFFITYRFTGSILYSLKWLIFSSVFIGLGLILFFLGLLKGFFSDYDLSKKEERYEFYFLILGLAFLYLVASLFFKGIFFPLSIVALGIVFGVFVFMIVNYYIKASVHVGVACGFVISMFLIFGPFYLLLFWIIPLVAWSRLILKRHTIREVIAGALLGTTITFFTFYLGKYLLINLK